MRFATRIMIGATAAAVLAVGAPAAANASVATDAAAVTTPTAAQSSPYYDADWGTYWTTNHWGSTEGHVNVEKKGYQTWVWKTYYKKVKYCWRDNHGDRHCKWIKKKYTKKVYVWKYDYYYNVDSTLTNEHWWGKRRYVCSWENFKIEDFSGSVSYETYKNCGKEDQDFSFSGKNAKHIWVDVSRGNYNHSKRYNSGWMDVYHAS